jgi:biopolymer transport protein ExbD
MAGKTSGDGHGEGSLFADINVTPLVDVTLVLLIIFMVAAPLIVNVPSIKVNLPKAATADETQPSPLALTLQRDDAGGGHRIFANGRPTDEAGVRGMIPALVAKDPELQAVVSADRAIDYGEVMHFVDLVKSLGVNRFALSTEGSP